MMGKTLANNGLLNMYHPVPSSSGQGVNSAKATDLMFDMNKNSEPVEFDNLKHNINDCVMNVSFTTELYAEVIDGVYQERKNINLNSMSMGFPFGKRSKDKDKYSEYFRNLTYTEILNLIFLTDLKCFLTLQSSHALFLQKNTFISNLYSMLNSTAPYSSSSHGNQQLTASPDKKRFMTNIYLKDSSSDDSTSNIYNNNYNTNFYESIRILPDLKLLPKKKVRSELSEKLSASRRILEKPIGRGKLSVKLQPKQKLNLPNVPTKESNSNKKKRSDAILLSDQLKPVLDCLTDLRLPINIDFQFNLRGILFESALFVNVFEDIPVNLFKSNLPRNNSTASLFSQAKSGVNNSAFSQAEMGSIRKIQKLFLANIDEHLRKMDGFHLCKKLEKISSGSGGAAVGSSQSPSTNGQDELKNFDAINKEIKNALILKLR